MKKIKTIPKLEIDQLLLAKRQIFLLDSVNEKTAENIVKQLLALNNLNKKPIVLWINSPGGSVSAGLSIVDTMKHIESKVITVIVGEACSMGAIISVCGDTRLASQNSFWMAHDMAGGVDGGDYTEKVIFRAQFLEKCRNKLLDILKNNTKLNKEELNQAVRGELWLNVDECIKKGIVDKTLDVRKK